MSEKKYPVSIIISGGQTGADRAGLDFAISKDIFHGGWCPLGRIAEDGRIPEKYNLKETSTSLYPQRTRLNVKDSDATIIFTDAHISRGAMLTIKCCIESKKPHYIIPISETIDIAAVKSLLIWLFKSKPHILNIAGARESKCPFVHKFAISILSKALQKNRNEKKPVWPPQMPFTPSLNFEQLA